MFTTHFNSSSIFSEAVTAGRSIIKVQVAIQYPAEFYYEQNWFDTETEIQVVDKLSVAVPEFVGYEDRMTHLYMMPRNVVGKIVTNKNVKLKMGYSMQSVFVNSSNSYQYKEGGDIIELIDNGGIRTLDKYGKVTVILEESQQAGDQVVMLNVLITDVYSLSAENFYEALSLPLASSINIPLRLQNERGHLFARNLTGISVGVQLSHPRVVTAEFD